MVLFGTRFLGWASLSSRRSFLLPPDPSGRGSPGDGVLDRRFRGSGVGREYRHLAAVVSKDFRVVRRARDRNLSWSLNDIPMTSPVAQLLTNRDNAHPPASVLTTPDESLFTRYCRRNRRTQLVPFLESKKEISAGHVVAPQFLSSYPLRWFVRASPPRCSF